MEDATWEPKVTMRAQYPQLFNTGNNFEDKILLRGEELQHSKLYPDSFIACLGYNIN